MCMIQVKDMVSLRQVSAELATRTIGAISGFNNPTAYDINNHLAIAKAIENYIKGDADIPEVENHEKAFTAILENMKSSFDNRKPESQAPNFKVND